jgi:multiple sugar transport system permease protein
MSSHNKTIKYNTLKSTKVRKRIADIICLLLIIMLAIAVLTPLWFIVRGSLMSSQGIFRWPLTFLPDQWLWSNFNHNPIMFDYFLYLRNTMAIVIPTVVFGVSTCIMVAYALARLRFKGKNFIFALCVGSMLLPGMVTLIPLYLGWSSLGLVGTYWPLILPYLTGGGAFHIFLLRQFMLSIPRDFDEAAMIDGAGFWRIMIQIIVPMIKPAIIVVGLLIFILNYNDLLGQMIYIGGNKEMFTLAVGITTFLGNLRADYAAMFAAVVLTFLPTVIVFLFGQRFFVEGIVLSGIKS